MLHSITVLLTGIGAPGAPGIINCLRKNGERDIRIIGVDANENAGGKDMVDRFYTIPAAKEPDFIDHVFAICVKEGVRAVLPIVTRELMKFSMEKKRFEDAGIEISVMSASTLDVTNNKASLLTAMREAGLQTPEFFVVNTVEEVERAAERIGYPDKAFCVKKAQGNGSRGVRLVDPKTSRYDLFFENKPNSMHISYDELMRTLSERGQIPEMLVMEYLPGCEYSVDFLADKGKVLYSVCRKAISVVTSNMMSLTIENDDRVIKACEDVVGLMEMDGNFGFDLLCRADGQPLVIECNPRLTAGVVSCAVAGVNMPYLGVKKLLGEALPVCTPEIGIRMMRRYEEVFFTKDGNKIAW